MKSIKAILLTVALFLTLYSFWSFYYCHQTLNRKSRFYKGIGHPDTVLRPKYFYAFLISNILTITATFL